MLNGPGVLVVVPRIVRRFVPGFETSAQKSERSKVALAHHGNARIEKHGSRDADPLLIAPRLKQATPVGYYLTAARRTHVSQEREFRACLRREGEHRPRSLDHLTCQVVTVFVQHSRSTAEHIEAISAWEVDSERLVARRAVA